MTANEPAESSSSASIVNVAAIANVSTATVSRVLSGKRTKDDDIARRVRAAAHSLNYSVNFAASALRSTVTRTIGLIVPSVQDPFSARLIDTLEPLVNRSGRQLALSVGRTPEVQKERIVLMAARHVDGLMSCHCPALIWAMCWRNMRRRFLPCKSEGCSTPRSRLTPSRFSPACNRLPTSCCGCLPINPAPQYMSTCLRA